MSAVACLVVDELSEVVVIIVVMGVGVVFEVFVDSIIVVDVAVVVVDTRQGT